MGDNSTSTDVVFDKPLQTLVTFSNSRTVFTLENPETWLLSNCFCTI
ncbi:hypothetical protein MRBBS_3398 [Marinobacter sp. BSs20148]|nr:hypothetical protein MRBBS_3398 [Marinobacter sp. BSs20148]